MKQYRGVVKALAVFLGGTFTLGGSIAAGFLLGSYLDKRYDSFLFSVLGIILGIISGIWQMYRMIIAVLQPEDDEEGEAS